MKKMIQFLSVAAVTLISAFATAQPLPPYSVVIQGQAINCSPVLSFVTLNCDQNNSNPINETFVLDANCSFLDSILVMDPAGTITLTYPCNGALITVSSEYSLNDYLFFVLQCETTGTDCLGIEGGSALPGTPCDDNDPNTINDMWTSDCSCQGETILPGECNADFWVVQGYSYGPGENPNMIDSTIVVPIPNELWVWNLSSTSSGAMTFLWSFGDGTSSTESFPTHVYEGTGPYELCLTIADASGCTDSYCQTISVDDDGIIVGVAGDELNGSRSVLTLNVVEQQPMSIDNINLQSEINLWPNPVNNAINVSIASKVNDQVVMTITDLHGKVVSQSKNTLRHGVNQIQMDVSDLNAGMYVLQIGNGKQSMSRRFAKQ